MMKHEEGQEFPMGRCIPNRTLAPVKGAKIRLAWIEQKKSVFSSALG